MKTQSVAFFHGGFEKLVHHWWKCVQNGGDYVQKYIQVIKRFILVLTFKFHLLKNPYLNKSNRRDGSITFHSSYVESD